MGKKLKKVKKTESKVKFIYYVSSSGQKEIYITTPKFEKDMLKECFGGEMGRLVYEDEKAVPKKYRLDEIDLDEIDKGSGCTIFDRVEYSDPYIQVISSIIVS